MLSTYSFQIANINILLCLFIERDLLLTHSEYCIEQAGPILYSYPSTHHMIPSNISDSTIQASCKQLGHSRFVLSSGEFPLAPLPYLFWTPVETNV